MYMALICPCPSGPLDTTYTKAHVSDIWVIQPEGRTALLWRCTRGIVHWHDVHGESGLALIVQGAQWFEPGRMAPDQGEHITTAEVAWWIEHLWQNTFDRALARLVDTA